MIKRIHTFGYKVKAMPRPKSKGKRIEIIVAHIERIAEHCVKVATMPDHESNKHWQKEVALLIFNLTKVKMPNGRNIDTEVIEQLTRETVDERGVEADTISISLKYARELIVDDSLAEKIIALICSQYQNFIFDKDYRIKDVYKSKEFKAIQC